MLLLAASFSSSVQAQTDSVVTIEAPVNTPVPCPTVDTIDNIGDIIDGGLFYLRNAPEPGSPIDSWVAYIIGIVGFLFGVYKHVRGQSTNKDGARR